MKNRGRRGKKKSGYALLFDVIIIAIGMLVAVILSRLGIIDALVYSLRNYSALASFIAGIFFTSTFTIAPASVAIVHIASYTPLPIVAIWGALGAMCGDLILFFFIKDRFAEDLRSAVDMRKVRHFFHSFHFGFLKWLAPVLGAVIIASPLPDEFGISLLGMSKIRTAVLMPISYVMNFFGIFLIVGFANLIS
jgi:hypothetical protein